MAQTLLFLIELIGVQSDRRKKDALFTNILSLLAEKQNAATAKMKPQSERKFKREAQL
jgi:hypothetical protein